MIYLPKKTVEAGFTVVDGLGESWPVDENSPYEAKTKWKGDKAATITNKLHFLTNIIVVSRMKSNQKWFQILQR